jgi:histidine triad (HIT) family protein
MPSDPGCIFCEIARGDLDSALVFSDEISVAFLDTRPLFPGHTLLIPRQHVETLPELPSELVGRFFRNLQRLTTAVERAMEAEGVFVANNNRVSQTVPHLHLHVVPRRKGDGLKGFFWPRQRYSSEAAMQATAAAVRSAMADLT